MCQKCPEFAISILKSRPSTFAGLGRTIPNQLKILLSPERKRRKNRAMIYWHAFEELIRTPFQYSALVWGIVPLYFGLLFNELSSAKANFRTAIQTGFSFLWAGAQWLWPYFSHQAMPPYLAAAALPVNFLVTLLVLTLGAIALVSGLRRKFPKYGRFLGHTRFANYFMIAIFPMQSHFLPWTWLRLEVITLFAVPVWLALHFGLMPLRHR